MSEYCAPYILTARGNHFDFLDPQPEQIHIEDIAWALAHNCRYTGHVRHFYSVAQHCFIMSFAVPERFALTALLHDASEAYIADISRPLKQLLPDYQAMEARIEKAIAAKFGTEFPLPPTVKQADTRMLATEYRDLMPPDPTGMWAIIKNVVPLPNVITPFSPEYAREAFMARFIYLTKGAAT